MGRKPGRKSDPRKVSVYLPEAMRDEILAEGQRQDRSISWLLQKAWRRAREEIQKMPGDGLTVTLPRRTGR